MLFGNEVKVFELLWTAVVQLERPDAVPIEEQLQMLADLARKGKVPVHSSPLVPPWRSLNLESPFYP